MRVELRSHAMLQSSRHRRARRSAGYFLGMSTLAPVLLYAQTRPAHAPGTYVAVGDARIWAESEGRGEPVVLVAGAGIGAVGAVAGALPFRRAP